MRIGTVSRTRCSHDTWAGSPIKFQADMGLLLAFMFLLDMLGSMIQLPALAHFLLAPARTARPASERAFPPGDRRLWVESE